MRNLTGPHADVSIRRAATGAVKLLRFRGETPALIDVVIFAEDEPSQIFQPTFSGQTLFTQGPLPWTILSM